MWKITYDWTEKTAVDVKSANWDDTKWEETKDKHVKIKLYDDDHNLYYDGESDRIIDGSESAAFAPLDWATNYAGCSYLKYKDPKTKKWEVL